MKSKTDKPKSREEFLITEISTADLFRRGKDNIKGIHKNRCKRRCKGYIGKEILICFHAEKRGETPPARTGKTRMEVGALFSLHKGKGKKFCAHRKARPPNLHARAKKVLPPFETSTSSMFPFWENLKSANSLGIAEFFLPFRTLSIVETYIFVILCHRPTLI